jgi:hypothetical protein
MKNDDIPFQATMTVRIEKPAHLSAADKAAFVAIVASAGGLSPEAPPVMSRADGPVDARVWA